MLFPQTAELSIAQLGALDTCRSLAIWYSRPWAAAKMMKTNELNRARDRGLNFCPVFLAIAVYRVCYSRYGSAKPE